MLFNFKSVINILSILIIFEGITLFIMTIFAIIYNENIYADFLIAFALSCFVGMSGYLYSRKHSGVLQKREGSLIVASVWIIYSLIGLIPYYSSGYIPSFTDAFFETMSGFTTTGASILNNIEDLPASLLLWRSLTHWIGGIGVIVISLALFPVFGLNAAFLFDTQQNGLEFYRDVTKVKYAARRLMFVYILLTLVLTVLLNYFGMSWFDAINHAFSTISTGGFSTKQASLAYWDNAYIQYTIIVFMTLAGVNYGLFYLGYKGKLKEIIRNDELRSYLSIIILAILFIVIALSFLSNIFNQNNAEYVIRNIIFYVISVITSTGFGTIDYMEWPQVTWLILIILMIIGACSGSTAGGIKQIRFVIFIKCINRQFFKILHPNSVSKIKYNQSNIQDEMVYKAVFFILIYLAIIFIVSCLLAFTGLDLLESISSSISCFGGVGPALGVTGPMGNYSALSDTAKWILSITMLLGRLEIYALLLIFTPYFWRS